MAGARASALAVVALLAIVLPVGLLGYALQARAPVYVVVTGDAAFMLVDNQSYVFLGRSLYAEQVEVYGGKVYFLNARLGSESGPYKSFSLSVSGANATLLEIGRHEVTVELDAPTGAVSVLAFGYDTVPPYTGVYLPSLGYTRWFSTAEYYRSRAEFEAADPPAVYWDAASKTLYVKALHQSPVNVTVLLPGAQDPRIQDLIQGLLGSVGLVIATAVAVILVATAAYTASQRLKCECPE